MSMFDAQAISETFMPKTASGDCASPVDVERALRILQAFSLISVRHTIVQRYAGRVFDLHHLVRLVTRDWLTMNSAYNYWLAEAIDVMLTKYEELAQRKSIWTRVNLGSLYIPHAQTLISSPQLLLQGDDIFVLVPQTFYNRVFAY